MNPIQEKTITKRLPCLLTDEERLAFADQLAESKQRVDEAVDNKKSMMKQMQAEIDQAAARHNKINDIVATKTEYREIDVVVQFDYDKGRVTQVRKDTGEEIMNRPMTEKEKQRSLLDDGPQFNDDSE